MSHDRMAPMAIGHGKYDDECTEVREKTKAGAILLIILGGEKGDGFSVQIPVEMLGAVPSMLRYLADEIQKDYRKMIQSD